MKKRVIKLTEAQLRDIVKKTMLEQRHQYTGDVEEQEQLGNEQGTEDQYMTGPDAGAVSGGEDTGEVSYDEFLTAAQALIGQGITIGGLVDKLCEAQNSQGEEEIGDEGGEDLPPTDDYQLTR
jgi:hypothetical protein